MPLSGSGVSEANRIVLMLMHLAVGAIVIAVLYRTSPGRSARSAVGSASAAAHGAAPGTPRKSRNVLHA